jgi:hypothetical protein
LPAHLLPRLTRCRHARPGGTESAAGVPKPGPAGMLSGWVYSSDRCIVLQLLFQLRDLGYALVQVVNHREINLLFQGPAGGRIPRIASGNRVQGVKTGIHLPLVISTEKVVIEPVQRCRGLRIEPVVCPCPAILNTASLYPRAR